METRASVCPRLAAAVEQTFVLFERTIAEYEEEICRLKEENERKQKLVDAVWNPKVLLHRADVQHLLVVQEEVPKEQHDWSPSLDQDDPGPPHVKEELCTNQGLEEADITKFPFTPVPVKSEDDEEKAQSSHLHQRQPEENREEPDGEDCGGSEPGSSFHPQRHLQTHTGDQPGDSEDTEDSEDWRESSEPESHVNKNTKPPARSSTEQMEMEADGEDCGGPEPDMNVVHIKDLKRRAAPNSGRPFSKSKSRRTFDNKSSLERHMKTTRDRPSGVQVTTSSQKENTTSNMRNNVTVRDVGSKIKPHNCSECGKTFECRAHLKIHTRIHTGEKPFRCSVCKRRFRHECNVRRHTANHTGGKPFGCSVCGKRFAQKSNLDRHSIVHTGEKPSRCPVCQKCFSQKSHVQKHMKIHKR